jgi:hypothetical protein
LLPTPTNAAFTDPLRQGKRPASTSGFRGESAKAGAQRLTAKRLSDGGRTQCSFDGSLLSPRRPSLIKVDNQGSPVKRTFDGGLLSPRRPSETRSDGQGSPVKRTARTLRPASAAGPWSPDAENSRPGAYSRTVSFSLVDATTLPLDPALGRPGVSDANIALESRASFGRLPSGTSQGKEVVVVPQGVRQGS